MSDGPSWSDFRSHEWQVEGLASRVDELEERWNRLEELVYRSFVGRQVRQGTLEGTITEVTREGWFWARSREGTRFQGNLLQYLELVADVPSTP